MEEKLSASESPKDEDSDDNSLCAPRVTAPATNLQGCSSPSQMFYESLRDKDLQNVVFLVENDFVNVNMVFNFPFVTPEFTSWTALHVACKRGQLDLVRKLLVLGADPKLSDKKGETPLHIVCKHGNSRCVEILLQVDSSLKDIRNKQGLTPLCKTLYRLETPFKEKQYYKTVDLLIEAGCDVNLSPITNMTPLHLVAQKWCNSKVIKKLIDAGADVNVTTTDSSPLMSALCRQRVDKTTVSHLIDAGANVNYRNPSGKSVLHVAVAKSEDICVKHLLNAGADPNALDGDGNSPLWIAVSENNITITPLLLEYGGHVNFVSRNRHMSLLCLAAGNGNKRIGQLLLSYNADVDIATDLCEAPLHYAVLNRDVEFMKLLLKRNCRLDLYVLLPDIWEHESVLDIAVGACDEKIIKLLLRVGFPVGLTGLIALKSDLKDHEELYNWIKNFVCTPKSLLNITRIYLRKEYGTQLLRILETLVKDTCIPKQLAQSILMEDLLND